MKKIIVSFIVLFSLHSVNSGIFTSFNYSKGPLIGKNTYLPFLIYYNLKGISAESGKQHDFNVSLSTTYTQDFYTGNLSYYPYINSDEIIRYYDTRDIIRDYESCINEISVVYNPLDNLKIGADFRLIAYYGGFLDLFIEGFHTAFGFPGGARDYFERDRVFVNIINNSGVSLYLDKPAVSFGDIDLWMIYTFFEMKHISVAGLFAFKIPSGNPDLCSGSGYPDMAFAVLADFTNLAFFSFFLQAGIVVPFDSMIPDNGSNPYPMFNGLVSVEFHPTRYFSLVAQLFFRNLPIDGYLQFSWDNKINYYNLPQINLMVGFIVEYQGHRWQFYFEEDTFTNQGADIVFSFSYGYKLNLQSSFL